jgi:hypothetical protein
MKTTTLPLKHSINRSPYQLAFVLIPLALACFALSPQARAVCQEGCDTNTFNTFLGEDALINNTGGVENTAVGAFALSDNTFGVDNTAIGKNALGSNTFGDDNTAIGTSALNANTIGESNTAVGGLALLDNTSGSDNTANGVAALTTNTTGSQNAAIGRSALKNNTTGNNNTAVGFSALIHNNTGRSNIAVGFQAGGNLTTGRYNIDIGNLGVASESSTIRIGTTGSQTDAYVAGISGATIPTGVPVIVDTTGHLGTTTSSARFKEAIKPMEKASETILALKPVTFRYKHDLDPEGIPQFGLVAEQVEKVNPDLVARDDQGKPYTVRYEAVNAMLLNEFLKARRQIDAQQKEIDALKAGLRKVSAQLEVSKGAPQTVLNE